MVYASVCLFNALFVLFACVGWLFVLQNVSKSTAHFMFYSSICLEMNDEYKLWTNGDKKMIGYFIIGAVNPVIFYMLVICLFL